MIDVGIGTAELPALWILAEVGTEIFMHFLLQIAADEAKAADHKIGANAGVGGWIAPRIAQANIGGIIANRLLGHLPNLLEQAFTALTPRLASVA